MSRRTVNSSFTENPTDLRRSTILEDVTLTSSGLGHKRKSQLCDKVQRMGGRFLAVLSQECTHLVCESTDGEKYKAAARLGIKIVNTSWVLACWEQEERLPLQSKYLVPPFLGCTFSVTGLESIDDRNKVRDFILRHGGKFSANLDAAIVTHLIAKKPEGDKYNAAVEWGTIAIVRLEWLEVCIKKSVKLPEEDFPVLLPGLENVASPLSGGGTFLKGICHDQAHLGNSQGGLEMAVPAPQQMQPTETSLHIDVAALPESQALIDAQIYICGYQENDMRTLGKMIDCAMGTWHSKLSPYITHAIIGDSLPTDQRTLQALYTHSLAPHLVKVDWVIDSVKSSTMKEEHKYLVGNSEDTASLRHKQAMPVFGGGKTSWESSIRCEKDQPDIHQQEFHQQVVPSTFTETLNSSFQISQSQLTFSQCHGGFLQHCLFIFEPHGLSNSIDVAQLASLLGAAGAAVVLLDGHPLEGGAQELRRRLDLSLPISKQNFCAVVSDHGIAWADNHTVGRDEGEQRVLFWRTATSGGAADGVANYLETERRAQPVTQSWLKACLKRKVILDPQIDSFVFIPQYFKFKAFPKDKAQSMRFCISTYSGVHRCAIEYLAQNLGVATVSPKLSRKITHLILPEKSGAKCEQSIKWGSKIVLVKKEWLYHCAQHGYTEGSEANFQPCKATGKENHILVEDKTGQQQNANSLNEGAISSRAEPEVSMNAKNGLPLNNGLVISASCNASCGPDTSKQSTEEQKIMIDKVLEEEGMTATQADRSAELDRALNEMGLDLGIPSGENPSGSRKKKKKKLCGTVEVSDATNRILQKEIASTNSYSATLRSSAVLSNNPKFSKPGLPYKRKANKSGKKKAHQETSLALSQDSQIVYFEDQNDDREDEEQGRTKRTNK